MSWTSEIRDDVIARIVAAGTSAGGRIENCRVRQIAVGTSSESGTAAATVDTLPLVAVATRGLRREPRGQGSRYMLQTCQLVIACFGTSAANAPSNAMEAAENVEEEIFNALRSDGEWLRLYEEPPRLLQGEAELTVTGGQCLAVVTQVWELTAQVERAAPVHQDALETVVTTIHTDPQPEIVNQVDGLDA
jgi:hypothetical protein